MTQSNRATRVGSIRTGALLALIGASLAPVGVGAQSFSGTGPGATSPFVLLSGERAVTVSTAVPGSFEAYLLSQSGSVVATLSGAERQEIRVPTDGRYVFDVRASDDWSIRVEPADPAQLERARGRIEGSESASGAQSSAAWLGKGLAAGLLLGPIGTALAVQRAGGEEPALPAAVVEGLADEDPPYAEAFRQAYAERLRASQRASALIGGLTGTAILTFALLQLTVWGDEANAPGELPRTGENAARVPILTIRVP